MKTTKRHKTPEGYKAPLRSRAAILAWLTDRAANDRGRHHGLFTFNVKLHNLKTEFSHLCELARKNGDLAADASARYLADVEAVYRSSYETIWDTATEGARRSVVEDDTNRMLWDGHGPIAEWTFDGRSSGWLVLKEFDGTNLEGLSADYLQDLSFPQLRRLYRFLIQCAHDFRRPESEIEHQAAFELFANFADKVETDEQEAARIVAEKREAAERLHWEARDTVTV